MTSLLDEICAAGWCSLALHLGPRGLATVENLVMLVTMMETFPLAQVKAHLSELVGRVNSQHDRVTVTVHGRPAAVLLSLDDLDALEETIAILSDTDTMRQLVASDAELARGEGEVSAPGRVRMGTCPPGTHTFDIWLRP